MRAEKGGDVRGRRVQTVERTLADLPEQRCLLLLTAISIELFA